MRQLPLPLSWSFSKDVKDFVVSDCNRYAFEWLEKWPLKIHSQVVCLVGKTGAGKTHLAHIWADKMGAKWFRNIDICYETISNEFERVSNEFFVLDDADEVKDEFLLFYLFNVIKSSGAYLLMTAKDYPNAWKLGLEDIRSRLSTVDVVQIHKPNDTAISSIISKMLNQRGLIAPDDVITFISNRIERTYSSISYWVNRIDTSLIDRNHKLSIHSIKSLF